MFKISKSTNRLLLRLTLMTLAACLGLFVGLAKSSESKMIIKGDNKTYSDYHAK